MEPAIITSKVAREVYLLVQKHAPVQDIYDAGVELMAVDGLGFDSIGLVQLLLACEERLGIPLPTDSLLSAPLTLGRLIAEAERSVSRAVEPNECQVPPVALGEA